MGELYDQMVLRQSPDYREFIHAGILHVADEIRNEDESTPYHDARVAMAEKIITTSDDVVRRFIDRVIFRGVMEPSIRDSVVKQGRVAIFMADEDAVLNGIRAIWNETTLAVWPTVLDDIAGEE